MSGRLMRLLRRLKECALDFKRLQMCRGSSVADIYSKSASEGSSICGTLNELAPGSEERYSPAPSSPLMPRPLGKVWMMEIPRERVCGRR
ncbi:hypothetical protein DPX16_4414 [Anabarilius grahami]|uniref:Uncharacterized protein n=1 Tax=Anabarilius grahami TaxID=495550 RepID=A0A3N0XGB8_ANAGA|nr:hypothetical protein DPX16_4414 [Anabarilius grahami]